MRTTLYSLIRRHKRRGTEEVLYEHTTFNVILQYVLAYVDEDWDVIVKIYEPAQQ